MKIIEISNPFGTPVYYKEETESTMSDMASLKDAAHGTVIMAGYQKNGKGRGAQRIWDSGRNENLLFTISLSPDSICHPLIRVPLICGLALSRFLQIKFNIDSELKWPNDVLIENKKISGILCEYRNGFIHAGIGINCNATVFKKEVQKKATSLKLLGVEETQPIRILQAFLPVLKDSLEDQTWKDKAERVLFGKGRDLEILEGPTEKQERKRIRITGLDDDGLLKVVETKTGRNRTLLAGEISFADFI